ncbi:MAG: sialidase family protein, partial [Verrucomicrobiota bacterium]
MNIYPRPTLWLSILFLTAVIAGDASAQNPSKKNSSFQLLPFKVKLDTVLEHDDGKSLWFQPRVAVVPGLGKNGQPTVFLTLQKLLGRSDYFSGLSVMRTNDMGKSWSEPDLRPELEWVHQGKIDIAVADVTPDWHPQTAKVIAIGAQVRYSVDGHQLEDIKRAHQTAYAVLDPKSEKWTKWQQIKMPDDEQFNFARSACGQFLVEPDGSLLLPFYIGKDAKTPWSITVARFSFDGTQLKYIEHGN